MQASHLYDLSPGSGLPLLLLLTGTNEEQRAQERQETAHRNLLLNIPWQFPLFYYICKKGPDQMSLVSINQPYRKAMINSRYNYQDNHQSYSSRPMLWVILWNHLRGSSPDNWSVSCLAKVSKLVEEGRRLEKVSKISFCSNCTFREALSCKWNLICSQL